MAHGRQFNWPKTSVLVVLIVLVVTSLSAKTSDYLTDVWTSDNGLPDSSVTSIAQTPDGYLWIGTYNGLARFDGVRFVTFDPINTPALKNARITRLSVDAWGALWINTYDGSMTSLRNGVFTPEWQGGQVYSVFSFSNQVLLSLAGHHATIVYRTGLGSQHSEWKNMPLAGQVTGNSIEKDGSGTIWYTVKKDLYRMTGTNSEIMTSATGYRGKLVTCMSVDREGNFWIGTDEGIARWNHGQFEDQTPTNGEPGVSVSTLYNTRNGCWVFANGKVRKAVDRRWVAEVDAKSWRNLVGTFQLDLNAFQDRDGGMWFAHLGSGLFHIQPDGKAEHISTENGLPSDLANCWFQDREGNIWAGLIRGGLVRLRQKQFLVLGPAQGVGASAVSSVCEDGQSNIWIGTFSGGLYRWGNEKLDRFTLPEGAYKDCFFSAYPDSKNRLLLSAGREDLFMIENGQIIPSTKPVHGIKTILVDSQERVWLGQLNGLSYLDKGSLKTFPATNGLNNIRSLAKDQAGGVWIGTGEGNLFHFEDGNFTRYQTHDGQENRAIWSILSENDGTVWVGTFRGGLLRFKDGKFTRYAIQDGLPSDIICQILDDGLGKLWIGSHKGIFCVPKSAFHDLEAGRIQSLPCVAFGLSDGLPTLECSGSYQPACWRGQDGRLWFATAKGLVAVLPGELPVNYLPPSVIIEEILVDGKSYPASSNLPPVLISPGKHQLDFRYTALSFKAPEKVAFRYRLQGFEEDWVDGGTKRSAHYGPLRPGKYRFQVLACNNDGVWNEDGSAINLLVQPHFWQTWWFETSTTTAAIIALILTVRYVVKAKMRRKLERLEQAHAVERERQRIARDIHDDLGAGLTQILLQSSLASCETSGQTRTDLNQISDNTRELVRKMDEIVWAVTPEKDTLDSLVTYVGKFVQEFCAATKIRCRMDLPAQLPDIAVSTDTRHGLFLAVKEAMNNVAKHAGATEVLLQFKLHPDAFSFVISDNGVGLNISDGPAQDRIFSGRGLQNLAQRLETLGGTCVVSAALGGGTQVKLTVRINNKR